MGNCFSAHEADALRDLVRPADAEERVLTAKEISHALTIVASALHKKKLSINIVAVGGAVNTILLRTRASTSDVDFFYQTKTRTNEISTLLDVATSAAKSLSLEKGWLNNHVAVFVEEGTIKNLYDEAIRQNARVFEAPGLVVYAAPWRFALVTKLDRLSKPGRRSYDMTDAVSYLHHLIVSRGGRAVGRNEIAAWDAEFKLAVIGATTLDELDSAYQNDYGTSGLSG